MSKNILVISASLRNGSNSDMLADEFVRGALESSNKAEKITLRGKSINFCKGCLAGQLKTFLDRTNPLFPAEYNFTDIYFLITAADTEQSASEGPLKGLQGWIDCFENAGLKGVVCGLGAEKPGDIKSMPAMNEAYMLGKQA